MASLMLLNPRKRKATKRRARRNPVARATARPTAKLATNPRRRRRASPLATYRRRAKRNPIKMPGGLMPMLTDAAVAGAGAVAVDYLIDALPLGATMKTGWTGVGVKAAAAVALGIVGKKFLGSNAQKMATGALTVLAYSSIKGVLAPTAATVAGLGYRGPAQKAGMAPQLAQYINSDPFQAQGAGMGEYVYQ